MRFYLRSLVDKKLHLEGTAASFFKVEYFIVYHEDTGRMFISIQWLDFGRSLRKSVANCSVYFDIIKCKRSYMNSDWTTNTVITQSAKVAKD